MTESAIGSDLPGWLPFEYVFDRLRDRFAGLSDAELLRQPAADGSVPTIAWRLAHIADTLRELIHHAAEVALLRDLYAANLREPQSRS